MYEILYYLNLNYKGKNFMNKKILGMGNAVLDIVSSVSDDFLKSANLTKGAMTLVDQNDQLTVDKLNWKGEAKKSGIQMGDIISNFKIENPDRPNKAIIYPFALLFLLFFGYINFKSGKLSPN